MTASVFTNAAVQQNCERIHIVGSLTTIQRTKQTTKAMKMTRNNLSLTAFLAALSLWSTSADSTGTVDRFSIPLRERYTISRPRAVRDEHNNSNSFVLRYEISEFPREETVQSHLFYGDRCGFEFDDEDLAVISSSISFEREEIIEPPQAAVVPSIMKNRPAPKTSRRMVVVHFDMNVKEMTEQENSHLYNAVESAEGGYVKFCHRLGLYADSENDDQPLIQWLDVLLTVPVKAADDNTEEAPVVTLEVFPTKGSATAVQEQ